MGGFGYPSYNKMANYILFCAPDTYAMAAHAILEEVEADYKVKWVEIFVDDPDPNFIKASPHGRTPALLGPDGSIFETAAISLYIAERYPRAGLVVPQDDTRRGKFLQWLYYLSSTLQPDVIIQYHPEFYHDDSVARKELLTASMNRLRKVYEILEKALDRHTFFFGEQPTVPDFILGMQTVWDKIFPNGDITVYPNIEKHRSAINSMPSVRQMKKQHAAEYKRRLEILNPKK